MKAGVPPRLGRLLGEYERLTRDEGAALRGHDFPALAAVAAFKPALLVEIVGEANAHGLDRRIVWFNDCLGALAALERDNVTLASRILKQLSSQRDNVEVARKRLRGLGNAYRPMMTRSSKLFALG